MAHPGGGIEHHKKDLFVPLFDYLLIVVHIELLKWTIISMMNVLTYSGTLSFFGNTSYGASTHSFLSYGMVLGEIITRLDGEDIRLSMVCQKDPKKLKFGIDSNKLAEQIKAVGKPNKAHIKDCRTRL